MSDDIPDNRPVVGTAIRLFFAIVLLIGWDLIGDYVEGTDWPHLAIELLILLIATLGIALLWHQLRRAQLGLGEALAEAEQWRKENQELMSGLGIAIQNQFSRWNLSRAESEVGLLLLKGLSHREVAAVRQTSERTTREQARALYRKSALSGRSALASFFLEDLLPPPGLSAEE
jgi:DNA-binding CsgD family transcriptional regulator